ncbi:MAG: hypothetical protein LVO36_04455 [Nitrosopumilus sp. (ex Thoosa mismalolli)]|nr:hypothetical protein [Nitrosopumilus sp. (ex Thoosa mismalolli)]
MYFESSLFISDHKILWAIYDNLGTNETRYHTLDAKKVDSFYPSIVISKNLRIRKILTYMILTDSDKTFREKIIFKVNFPSKEFYEPFGQVTHWKRQKVNFKIPNCGKYFITALEREKNQNEKYSLAVRTMKDFSVLDFFAILPTAWLQTKLFVNDINAIIIFRQSLQL